MKKLTIIAGNCILESLDIALETADFLVRMSKKHDFNLIFKSSFKKDNRSDCTFFRGLSIPDSIGIFQELKKRHGFRILTDFHNLYEIDSGIKDVIDILQIPAYLCMQTELTMKLAAVGKTVAIKKGQFLHPADVEKIVRKIEYCNNHDIILIERGTSFGYRDLIVDPRSFTILKKMGYPVFFDAGHSVRKYGVPSSNLELGGQKEFINDLARAAIACKIDGIFVEVHPNPPHAMCDAATQLDFEEFDTLISDILPVWRAINE